MVATSAAACGALLAGAPEWLARLFGIAELTGFRLAFGAFAACLLVTTFLFALLSPAVEAPRPVRRWSNPLRLPSRRPMFTLVGLFSVDALGGALIMQSLVAYWFNTRFGLDVGSLAVVFFVSQLLSALSLWAAARIAARIGLLNTMVFTHIPASLLLIGAAFAPTATLAVVLWQARSLFSMMAVPTRDSYTMAIVGPDERVAMASLHMVGRSVASTVGPRLSTALWEAVSAAAPFVACGVLKIGYDLALFAYFRRVRPPEEVPGAAGSVAAKRE
ncbi:MAG: MFS transporter [SAR202 cluster bacterium]|nr:MFS transporter [SAR202 cluster bacterium]